jgi:hypothetical protein
VLGDVELVDQAEVGERPELVSASGPTIPASRGRSASISRATSKPSVL